MTLPATVETGSRRAVKWNVLPWPSWLSTQMRPSIIWTRRLAMVKPRPVPPNLRVKEPSTWVNASKINACFSAGMPIPVSRTEKCRASALSGERSIVDRDPAAVGEFDRVPDQVDQNLPEPSRIAVNPRRHVRPHLAHQTQPLGIRRNLQAFQRVENEIAEIELPYFQPQLAGFDLGNIQDVVDDGEKRGRGALDQRQILPLFGVQTAYPAELRSVR